MAKSRAEHLSPPKKKELDLKSVTNSQMAKSRAELLSPPKRKVADSQTTYQSKTALPYSFFDDCFFFYHDINTPLNLDILGIY
jgi:hypothetical protein